MSGETRRLAQQQAGEYTIDGKLVRLFGPIESAWIILHSCGKWTWEDANYCMMCCQPLDVMRGDPKFWLEDRPNG